MLPNLTNPTLNLGPPLYPPLIQLLRVTSSFISVPGSTANLYISSTQQLRTDTLTPRDREPCFAVILPDSPGLLPGYYLGRLAGSYNSLPVYEIISNSSGGTTVVGNSSTVPTSLFLPGLTQQQITYLTSNLNSTQLNTLNNLTACQLQVIIQLPISQLQALTTGLTPNQLTLLVDNLTYTQLKTIVDTLTTSQTIVISSAYPQLYSLLTQSLTTNQLTTTLGNLTSQQVSTLVDLTFSQVQTISTLNIVQLQKLTSLTPYQVGILIGELTSNQLSGLLDNLTISQLQQLGNNLPTGQIKLLVTNYTPAQIKNLIPSLTTAQSLQTLGNQTISAQIPLIIGQPSSVPNPSLPGYAPIIVDNTGKLWGYTGSSWQNLTGSSGGSTTFSGARVYHDAEQTIAGSTETAVIFNSERYDTNGYHSTSSNTSRLTVPSTGYYSIGCSIGWVSGAATGTYRYISLRVNGTTDICRTIVPSTINSDIWQNLSTDYYLTAGDYVEVIVFEDGTGGMGSLNISRIGNYTPEFWIKSLGT